MVSDKGAAQLAAMTAESKIKEFVKEEAEVRTLTKEEAEKLTIHPICSFYPEIEGEQRETFKSNIKNNGLIEAIVLFEGKVLDGRTRRILCLETNTPLRVIEFIGTYEEAEKFANSANDSRRHYTQKQNREQIVKIKMLHDDWSARDIAAWVHVDKNTVIKTLAGIAATVKVEDEGGESHQSTSNNAGGGKSAGGTTQQPKNLVPSFVSPPPEPDDKNFKFMDGLRDWLPDTVKIGAGTLKNKQKEECVFKLAVDGIVVLLLEKDKQADYLTGMKSLRMWLTKVLHIKPDDLDAQINKHLRSSITWIDVLKAYYKAVKPTDTLPDWVA